MGTRNLTLVIHEGKVRMAQYGQWDGYPEGLGKDISKVLQKAKLEKLRKAIDKCVFVDTEKVKQYYRDAGADNSEWVSMDVSDRFRAANPLLHRDYSGGRALSEILKVAKEKAQIELLNQQEFAADSLFCEWAYVIDLDNETVELYKGFNNSPLTKKDRFFSIQGKGQNHPSGDIYYPVRLMKSYPIKEFTCEAMDELTEEMAKEDA